MTEFSLRVIALLQSLPSGRVVSYGQLAALAGSPRAARQVVRLLHSQSQRLGLPWHRVLDRQGRIALPAGEGRELQAALLRAEGLPVDQAGALRDAWGPAFERYRWRP